MSKLIISNAKSTVKNIKRSSIETGFTKYNEISEEKYYLIAFQKLNIENENFINITADDFVATAGTLIYKDETGKSALGNIYKDFYGDISTIRNNIIGNYLLVIRKNNKIWILCDENNIFNVFYCDNKKVWGVSNSLFDIAVQENKKLTINEFNLIEYTFQGSIIGNGTVFNEIKRLMGDEYISIDLIDDIFVINKEKLPKVSVALGDIESMVSEFSGILSNKVETISNAFKQITICMTGGLDSRTILASFLKNNVKPDLVYGVGNSPLTNTKDSDLEINKLFADRYALNLHVMNWETPDKVDHYWEKYMKKYGFLSRIYNASNNVFSEFENNIHTDFIEFGYFGEPYRNVPWIENMSKSHFHLDEFLDEFYIYECIKKMYVNYEQYRNHLVKKFKQVCKENNIDHTCIKKNEFQILHNEYRKGGADNKLLNFSNMLFYSISILSLSDILQTSLKASSKYKTNMNFILRAIFKTYPDVLNIPFFSHAEDSIFDKRRFKLIEKHKKNKIVSNLKSTIKKNIQNEKLLNILKSINNVFKKENYSLNNIAEKNKEKELKEVFIKMVKSNKFNIVKYPEYFQGYVPRLAWYTQTLFMIKKILEYKNE